MHCVSHKCMHTDFYFFEQRETNSSRWKCTWTYQSDECVSYLFFADPSDPIFPKDYPTRYPPRHPDTDRKDTKSNEVIDKHGTWQASSPHVFGEVCWFIIFCVFISSFCLAIDSHHLSLNCTHRQTHTHLWCLLVQSYWQATINVTEQDGCAGTHSSQNFASPSLSFSPSTL